MRYLTPPGPAGVAVVAVPPAQRPLALSLLRNPSGTAFPAAWHGPKLAVLWLGGAAVDELLAVDRGPAGIELHLHGSHAVARMLRQHGLLDEAAPPQSPAARLLQTALDVAQLDLALEQLSWDFERWCANLGAAPPAERRAGASAGLLRSRCSMAMANPARLVLAGQQNAGKSTLFNQLVARERVLVGPLPGLTRDPVAETTCLGGYPYQIFDTAGVGPAVDALDHAAQQLATGLRDGALLVLVVDQARGPGPDDLALADRATLVVANKSDLPAAPWPAALPCHLRVAAATATPGSLRAAFGAVLVARRGLQPAGPVGGVAALDAGQLALLEALAAE